FRDQRGKQYASKLARLERDPHLDAVDAARNDDPVVRQFDLPARAVRPRIECLNPRHRRHARPSASSLPRSGGEAANFGVRPAEIPGFCTRTAIIGSMRRVAFYLTLRHATSGSAPRPNW